MPFEIILVRINIMKVLNYRVIVEKEKQGRDIIYVAYAPSIGISDFGKTVDEAVEHITDAIKLYLETLIEMRRSVPEQDSGDYFVTTSTINL